MHAIVIGAGMGGLFSALALRESGKFEHVDVYEQTLSPSTAGAGLNIAPNGARLCRWLGVDLDGGDPKGPHGAIDGGARRFLARPCQGWPATPFYASPSTTAPAGGTGPGCLAIISPDTLSC